MKRARLSFRAAFISVALAIASLLLIHSPQMGVTVSAQVGADKRPTTPPKTSTPKTQPKRTTTRSTPHPTKTASVPPASAIVRNQMGMELVYVPAGSLMMGSNKHDSEKPVHRVTIREGFYLGRYEVTQAQWQQVIGNNPSNFKGDDLPVEEVSWDDAQEFIRRINARGDGFTYRLPTEAEWEYACRAGTTGEYAGNLDAMAWYDRNSGSQTHPVGQKQPNSFGLYDMNGNVWEWCEDYYHASYVGAPTNDSAWSRGDSSDRVLRGGSWNGSDGNLRCAERNGGPSNNGNYAYGFRVVAISRSS
jgi:formylglycine-generating enzyme required for sulfatase activity